MARAERTFTTRCSLVVQPIDVWTGRPPGPSAVRVSVAGTGRRPVRTSDGCYAFLDVTTPVCTILVESSTYLTSERTVALAELPALSPVVAVPLLPNRQYPPPAAASGLVFAVTDAKGTPLADVEVRAYAAGEGAVRARLADEKAAPGETKLRVAAGDAGKWAPGDALVLRERDGKAVEWCRAGPAAGDDDQIVLETPLERAWKRGAWLLPAVETRSGPDGTVVLPFRGSMPASCEVVAELRRGGRSRPLQWELEGGAVKPLPPVVLQDP